MPEDYRVPERISDMVKRAEDALLSDKEKARRLFKLWAGVLPRKRAKRSNLFIRKIFSFVENAVSRYVEAMFQYDKYFDLESRSGQYTTEADNAEETLQYFLQLADFESKSIHMFKQSAIENMGVLKLGWRKTTRIQKQRISLEDALRTVPNFKMPPDLKNHFVFRSPDGGIALHPDDASLVFIWDADTPSVIAQTMEAQGMTRLPLEQAPKEVRSQIDVVVELPKVVYDGLEFTPIDFQDCFFDPDAGFVDELRYAGHHFGRTVRDLKDEQKNGIPYKNLDKVEAWAKGLPQVPDTTRYRRRGDLGKNTSTLYDEQATVFRVTELWHLQDGRVYTFVSTGAQWQDGILIRDEPWLLWHGELPYHFLPASIVPFEMVGVGPAELMEHLQLEKNEIRNILMDLKVMTISPPTFYNENVLDDPSKLDNLEPGKKIPIDVEPGTPLDNLIKTATINPAAFQNANLLEQAIDRDMEEVTGISKTAQGIPIGRRTTYSEQSLLSNEGNFRFRMQIRIINNVFKRISRQSLALLYQYLDPIVEVRITGDQTKPAFIHVDRNIFAMEYDVFPASTSQDSLANSLAEAQNMIQGYNAIRGTQMEAYMKPLQFLREYWRKQGVRRPERFIKTDEEMKQEQAQAQQQPQGQAQPQPQPAPPQAAPTDQGALIRAENQAMMQGQVPPVNPSDDHVRHIQGHQQQAQELEAAHQAQGMSPEEAMSDPRLKALVQHVQMHMQAEGANGQAGTTPVGPVG